MQNKQVLLYQSYLENEYGFLNRYLNNKTSFDKRQAIRIKDSEEEGEEHALFKKRFYFFNKKIKIDINKPFSIYLQDDRIRRHFSGTPLEHLILALNILENNAFITDDSIFQMPSPRLGSISYYLMKQLMENIRYLMNKGGEVTNSKNNVIFSIPNTNIVSLAIQMGYDKSIIERLVSLGVNLKTKDKYKRSCLHYAAQRGDLSLVLYLLDQGIFYSSFEERDINNHTPSELAAMKINLIIKELSSLTGIPITMRRQLDRIDQVKYKKQIELIKNYEAVHDIIISNSTNARPSITF